eukprot:2569964-Amphidinium_carterae.1
MFSWYGLLKRVYCNTFAPTKGHSSHAVCLRGHGMQSTKQCWKAQWHFRAVLRQQPRICHRGKSHLRLMKFADTFTCMQQMKATQANTAVGSSVAAHPMAQSAFKTLSDALSRGGAIVGDKGYHEYGSDRRPKLRGVQIQHIVHAAEHLVFTALQCDLVMRRRPWPG